MRQQYSVFSRPSQQNGLPSRIIEVHTFYEKHREQVIRIISARAAESHERKAYEEAYKGAETRHRSRRSKKRLRD